MNDRTLLLGIDIGTSSCKVDLFEPGGRRVAGASEAYPVYYPGTGMAEQNPDQWWTAVCTAVRRLLEQAGADPGYIAAIGVDGQSWSAIAIDGDGQVLCNTPIWTDTRAQAQCDQAIAQVGEERLFTCGGNPMKPAYTLPKVLWYRDCRPEVYGRADKILQSNGYIGYRLTGEIAQDLCQSYGYQCFDMKKGCWDEAIIRELGVRRSLLPEIVPCSQVIGRVTAQAARETGLSEGIPVVAGGLDAACGTLGAGVYRGGQTQEQGGQAGGMSICLDEYAADPRLILSRHVVDGTFLLQGGTVGGSGALKWLSEQLCHAEGDRAKANGTSIFEEMSAAATAVTPGSDGLIFLPYMAGERSPIWNPDAKGVFYGLDFTKTRAHMIRAVMEGTAYALRHNCEVAREAGAEIDRFYAMGGAANSLVWTQIKADVTGKPIEVPNTDSATTFGAAVLAGVGAGVYADFAEAVCGCVHTRRVHEPDRANRAVYDAGYAKYRSLYEHLKDMMRG